MIFLIKLLGILLGFAFPVFTIKAIKESLQGKSREQVYVVLSSVCGGAIMLIVMGLLPNTYECFLLGIHTVRKVCGGYQPATAGF